MFEVGQNSTGDPVIIELVTTALRDAGKGVGRDPDTVVGMFDDNDSTVLFDYLKAGITTLADLRATTEGLNQAREVKCEYPKITVRVLTPELALSLAYSHVEATLPDGTMMNINSRATNVWQKFGDEWKAIHEHSSVPIDIATGTANLREPI